MSSSSLQNLIAKVNEILARELRLPNTVTDQLTGSRTQVQQPAAIVYIPQAGRPETQPTETPWGFFLPIARIEVGPQRSVIPRSKIMNLGDTLSGQLGVRVAFEDTPGGGPLQLWVPKTTPSVSYFFYALRDTQLPHLHGIVGVDRRNTPVTLNMSETGVDQHLAILGPTTAGKSVIADALLLSMAYRTPPEIVRYVIFDCKSRAHEPWLALPHTTLYMGGGMANKKNILRGVAGLERLMDQRLASGIRTPVIIALFDDGREPEEWSATYRQTIGRLLRLGAGAGIRVVITAHQLKEDWAGAASRENLSTRIVSGTDVTTAAAQVGRGGSGVHNVDRQLRQFVLMRNNRTTIIYVPHLCQTGKAPDINRNDYDDAAEVISVSRRRYPNIGPLTDLTDLLSETAALSMPNPVSQPEQRTVGGTTYDDAVEIAQELLRNQPRVILADLAQALWGKRQYSGISKVEFLNDVLKEARTRNAID